MSLKHQIQVIVLAGGIGTRMDSSTPKLLSKIGSTTILRQLMEQLKFANPSEVLFLAGQHNYREIGFEIERMGRERYASFKVVAESERRGTLGALVQQFDLLQDDFLLVLGDLFLEFDFERFVEFARSRQSECAAVVHPNGHTFDSDSVLMESGTRRIVKVNPKGSLPAPAHASLAGIFYLTKPIIREIASESSTSGDIVFDCLIPWLNRNESSKFFAYSTIEYVKDSGTRDRITKIEAELQADIPRKLSRKNLKPAIFVDRDDTLIANGDKEMIVKTEIKKSLADINYSMIPIIGVSNQPSIAKGKFLFEVDSEFARLALDLESHNAFINEWYICPHHPNYGFVEENRFLKVNCRCRKPLPGLFQYAADDHCLDVKRSIHIGDSNIDYLACKSLEIIFFHTKEFSDCMIQESHQCFSSTSDALNAAKETLCR